MWNFVRLVSTLTLSILHQLKILLFTLGAISIVACVFFLTLDDSSLFLVLKNFVLITVFYAFLPFWVHEFGHLIALFAYTGGSDLKISSTPYRISIETLTDLPLKGARRVALTGPLASSIMALPAWLLGHPGIALAFFVSTFSTAFLVMEKSFGE